MIRFIALILSAFFFCACQSTPIQDTRHANAKFALSSLPPATAPLQLTDDTVIVDTRRPFDFAMAHLVGAINLRWQDFVQYEDGVVIGKLDEDQSKLTRRLARYGISPDSRIIIAGYGQKGQGQEGRLAWMFYYLGIDHIQWASEGYIQGRRTNEQRTKPPKNVRTWQPNIRSSINVRKQEVVDFINRQTPHSENIAIIDVRSPSEYLGRKPHSKTIDIGAVNVPWKEFIDGNGRIDPQISDKLASIGVLKKNRIILISNRGLRSATATMTLVSLGYQKAGNYAGGWLELLAD